MGDASRVGFFSNFGCLPYLRRKLCKRTPRVPHTEIT